MSGRTVVAESSAIAIGFSFQAQLDNTHILTAQTHVPADATTGEINERLDRIAEALDRIQVRYELKETERQLKIKQRTQALAKEARFRAEQLIQDRSANSDRRGPHRPSAQEQAEKTNFETTYARVESEIASDLERIAEYRKTLNGAGV